MAKNAPLVLTAIMQAAYLASKGSKCPFCQSNGVSAGTFEADGPTGHNEVSCDSCGESWLDVYTLSGIEPAKHSTFTIEAAKVIHVKAEFSDGTNQVCDVPDLETAGHEIAEVVTGCDFAITINSVALVDANDKKLKDLQATWSLRISETE